jgi:hypothetical protein
MQGPLTPRTNRKLNGRGRRLIVYRYFDVLIERRQHAQQLFHRNQLEMAAEQLGQVGLLHLDQLGGFGLGHFALGHKPFELNN